MRNSVRFVALGGLLALLGATAGHAQPDGCEQQFDSTYDLIQKAIFENSGCTESACHGAAKQGGLDLRAGVSYDALVDTPSQTVEGMTLVVPGQKEQSLLWFNLAAATIPDTWQAPLRAMPIGLEPLSLNELEAMREWIESGAPRDGVIPATGELLNACLPPAKPIEIDPLEPPAAGAGVQIHMPRWELAPHDEDETCFVSYYDVSDQVPAPYLSPDGTRFRYNQVQIRQDPLSHHLIVNRYTGSTNNGLVRDFRCRGGGRDGETCEPTDLGACGAGVCGSRIVSSFACIEFDGGAGAFGGGFTGTQETAALQTLLPGVYDELPTKGWILWNSHAFNLTDERGKIEAWLNFYFAEPDQQQFPGRDIFTAGSIFNMTVPPFETQEVCSVQTLPPNAHLFELSSHTHKRGIRFRTFLGAFRCDGGPRNGRACSPYGPDEGFETPDLCSGFPCRALAPPAAADCNGDLTVSVDELIQAINISLGLEPRFQCVRADPDADNRVTVSELVLAVQSNLNPAYRDPDDSLLYTSLVYNDPSVTTFDPPIDFPNNRSSRDARALTYCSLYDNGFSDARDVKTRSASPNFCAAHACTEGKVGSFCASDASCDSSSGAGDGKCDACTLDGGVTTEDEMFILLGSYYVD
jgi:hypothetical protein